MEKAARERSVLRPVCLAAALATALCLGLMAWASGSARAGDRVDFRRDILPVLRDQCVRCHGPRLAQSGLRLDRKPDAFRGGRHGPAIVPGDPGRSPLYRRLVTNDPAIRMPRGRAPLDKATITRVRRWIEQGAPWPEGVVVELPQDANHWAYAPIIRPPSPVPPPSATVHTPIDAFILVRLRAVSLSLSPPAPEPVLVRRVFLDLLGLPPSPEFVDSYLASTRPDRYERLVDRLLASPAFGERWAIAWLDAARYADSNGYQADQYREVWPYRDWVIRAINADKPFDRFTIEQLAGDLLPNATIDQRIATGFSRLTTCNVEAGVDPEENRVEQVVDRVNTVATVWLGTTLECAQCHDHKYDPFTMRDYYQLFAFFNNTPLEVKGDGVTYNFYGPKMELPLAPELARRRQELRAQKARLQAELDEAVAQQAQALADRLAVTPHWVPLKPLAFESQAGSSGQLLDDGSVLVTEPLAEKDTYRLRYVLGAGRLAALRLEALNDARLPGGGPGLHSSERPNFVLNELRARVVTDDGGEVPLVFATAWASYEPRGYAARHVVDGNLRSGWAIHPRFGQAHWIVLRLNRPVDVRADATLVVELAQLHGGTRLLGRFRLLATADDVTADVPAEIARLLGKPAARRSASERKRLVQYLAKRNARIARLARRVAELQEEIDRIRPPTTLVMVELPKPRATHVLLRGDYRTPGERVQPDVPAVLPPMKPGYERNRLGLARWLTDPDNPLVARVTVNRWWAELFGRGIVPTLGDFGTQGEPPSHPQLLDWLAAELVSHGWSRKRIVREIVTSAVYRQGSRFRPELVGVDPDNRLLARAPRVRLRAEVIRDQALQASGLLTYKLGGPPVYPPQPPGIWRHVGRNAPKYVTSTGPDRFRRGVYTIWRRSAPYPAFVTFDAPDRASCVVQRPVSNTPLQALTLMNDRAYAELALGLAIRVLSTYPAGSDVERLTYAFRCCLVRPPDDGELAVLLELVRKQRRRLLSRPQDAYARISPLLPQVWPGRRLEAVPEREAVELATYWAVANVLFNLDEMVTRE